MRKCRTLSRILCAMLVFGLAVSVLGFADSASAAAASDQTASEAQMESNSVSAQDGDGSGITKADNMQDVGYDIVFVVDNSRSIWKQQTLRDQAMRTVANLAVGSDVRIGTVYFADHVYKTFALTPVEGKTDYEKVISEGMTLTVQDDSNRDTNIGAGLKAGLKLFEDQDTSRQRIMIVLSDGINENYSQSSSYKKAADKLTEEQVNILKEQEIPLYCAFVQKDRADESYLRDMVNYFDSSNHYDQDRFVTVSDSQINKLADKFAQIFYSLRGDMKYKNITVDSSGRYTFHIPSLNVTKLQIYLNNPGSLSAKLETASGESGENQEGWSDGNCIFFTVKNPENTDWVLTLTGDRIEETTGTIAYYTDINAKVSVEGSSFYQGGSVYVNADFYDEQDTEIQLDEGAQVTADFQIISPDSGEVLQEIKDMPLSLAGGTASSDWFTLEARGDVFCTVYVKYDEFINLIFSCPSDMEVTAQPPSSKNYSGTIMAATVKTEKGKKQQFDLELQDYVSDPDSDQITVKSVDPVKKDNPVDVTIENGKLVCQADKAFSEVNFIITLEDETGLTTEMTVKGTIINMNIVKIILCVIALLIAILVIRSLMRKSRGKQECKELLSQIDLLKEQKSIAEKSRQNCEEKKQEASFKAYCSAYEQMMDFIREEQLPDQVQEVLQLKELAKPETVKTLFSEIDAVYEEVCKAESSIAAMIESCEGCENMAPKAVHKKLQEAQDSVRKAEEINCSNERRIQDVHKRTDDLVQTGDKIQGIMEYLPEFRAQRFRCNLVLDVMGEQCVKAADKNWYWQLDDITVMSRGLSVAEYFHRQTGIVFLPYEGFDEETEEELTGIMAAGTTEFDIREDVESDDCSERVMQAVLLRGKGYIIENSQIGAVRIEIR